MYYTMIKILIVQRPSELREAENPTVPQVTERKIHSAMGTSEAMIGCRWLMKFFLFLRQINWMSTTIMDSVDVTIENICIGLNVPANLKCAQ